MTTMVDKTEIVRITDVNNTTIIFRSGFDTIIYEFDIELRSLPKKDGWPNLIDIIRAKEILKILLNTKDVQLELHIVSAFPDMDVLNAKLKAAITFTQILSETQEQRDLAFKVVSNEVLNVIKNFTKLPANYTVTYHTP